MFSIKRVFSALAALILVAAVSISIPVSANTVSALADNESAKKARVEVPVNMAILIQDDLVSRVGNELKVTSEFIRSLPAGSRVMVGYITSGTLQVRQPFTEDLQLAAKALRVPAASTAVSPFNPYVEVIEALRKFDAQSKNRNVLLLISDGLDLSRGFDPSVASGNTIDIQRAIREAKRRNVAVYSFFAPSVGVTSFNRTAAFYGQNSLNRLSNETGGRAFFQGSSFVSFNSYFERLRETLNEQYATAY